MSGLALVCSLASCNGKLPTFGSTKPTASKSTPAATPLPPLPPLPKTEKLQITVEDLSDLQVKEGSIVVKGQIIAAPATAQKRLSLQRQALLQQLDQISNLAAEANLSATGAPSQDGVALAQARLAAAEKALVDFRKNSPFTDYALENLSLPEEQLKLERLKAERKAAQANLKQEQTRSKSPAPTASNQSLATLKITEANLNKELQNLDAKIKALKIVYSPYAGLIQQIKPLGTKNSPKLELTFLAQPPANALQPPTSPDSTGLPGSSPGLPPLPSAPDDLDTGLFLPAQPSPPPRGN
ncbi:MAG: hypothetical protein WA902_24750 [Thermosynechococcaceae cyanobacterium]